MGHRKGIKLIAYLPVSKATVLDIGTQPDQGAGFFHNGLKKSFIFTQGYFNDQKQPFDVDFNVFGQGFFYIPGTDIPVSGYIKKVDVDVAGQPGLEISGLHLSVQKAEKLWADDPLEAFAKLLVGDDFIQGSDYADPNLWGGKGNDIMWGRGGNDIVNGFKGRDVNDGGEGNDQLIDTKGKDWFQFSTEIMPGDDNLTYNFDTIKKFGKGDEIYLDYGIFGAAGMKVSKGEFRKGDGPLDSNDYFGWSPSTRIFWYDGDGSGSDPTTPIFQTQNDAKINHKVVLIGALNGYGNGYDDY